VVVNVQFIITQLCYTCIITFFLLISQAMTGYNLVQFIRYNLYPPQYEIVGTPLVRVTNLAADGEVGGPV